MYSKVKATPIHINLVDHIANDSLFVSLDDAISQNDITYINLFISCTTLWCVCVCIYIYIYVWSKK